MISRKEPLRIRGLYVGPYDAMSCPICRYYYFTNREYDLALSDARSLGLVGPALPYVTSMLSLVEIGFPSLRNGASFVGALVSSQEKAKGAGDNSTERPQIPDQRLSLAQIEIEVGEQTRL